MVTVSIDSIKIGAEGGIGSPSVSSCLVSAGGVSVHFFGVKKCELVFFGIDYPVKMYTFA